MNLLNTLKRQLFRDTLIRAQFSFSLFLKFSVEKLSLIFLGRLLQRRLTQNKSEVFHGNLSKLEEEEGPMYFLSLNLMRKVSP